MEAQPRCSHKYLVLQVWCGLLTVAMVVMAALLASIRSKSTEVGTAGATANTQVTNKSPKVLLQ